MKLSVEIADHQSLLADAQAADRAVADAQAAAASKRAAADAKKSKILAFLAQDPEKAAFVPGPDASTLSEVKLNDSGDDYGVTPRPLDPALPDA